MSTYEYTYEVLSPKWLEVTVEVKVTNYWVEPASWDSSGTEDIEWEFVGWTASDQDGHETCGSDDPPYEWSERDITRYLLEEHPANALAEAAERRAEYLQDKADWEASRYEW